MTNIFQGLIMKNPIRGKFQRLQAAIRTALSPRFVPNDIFQVAETHRMLSGKNRSYQAKKVMLGQPVEKVLKRHAHGDGSFNSVEGS